MFHVLSEDFLFLTHFCSFSRASPSVSPPSSPSSSLSSSSLQMPNTAQRASSAPRLVLAATLYPRASAPRWTKALTMLRWRPKVSIQHGRKHWSSSSAGSKGRGRRTAGRMTSRLAADISGLIAKSYTPTQVFQIAPLSKQHSETQSLFLSCQ